jgi:glucose-6-phosphate 1-dehydrogenase
MSDVNSVPSVTIFGASGDLTARKLVPALYCLAQNGYIPDTAPIIGVARKEKTDEQFRDELFPIVKQHSRLPVTPETWAKFAGRLFYRVLDMTQSDDYVKYNHDLGKIEKAAGVQGKRLFYMATAPDFFVTMAENLSRAGMIPDRDSNDVLRIVFEKPFGHDLASAQKLSADLGRLLREDQIYRIDHYLGKETVQNLLMFRFGNSIFEPLLNRTHVDHVQITVAESQGMEHGRGGYYDKSGAMRDVLQNHVLQLLALIAMEPPNFFEADAIHHEKLKVLSMMTGGDKDFKKWTSRGQYIEGTVDGKPSTAYRKEERIPPFSNRETFAALDVRIDNWRWAGVPFYLRTGKRMPERVSEIAILFKAPPLHLFKTVECDGDICELVEHRPNQLVFRIQPSEAISMVFGTKRPGMQYNLHPATMDFAYQSMGTQMPEAYERLLLDVSRGDSTLFMRNDELEYSWKFVTPVLQAWEADEAGQDMYPGGTWGPKSSDEMLTRVGRKWRTP